MTRIGILNGQAAKDHLRLTIIDQGVRPCCGFDSCRRHVRPGRRIDVRHGMRVIHEERSRKHRRECKHLSKRSPIHNNHLRMLDDLLGKRRLRIQPRTEAEIVWPTTLKNLRISRVAYPTFQYICTRDEYCSVGCGLERDRQAGTATTASNRDRLAIGSCIYDDATSQP